MNIDMNPASKQWHDMISKFHHVAGEEARCADGDFKHYDSSHDLMLYFVLYVLVHTAIHIGYTEKAVRALIRMYQAFRCFVLILGSEVVLISILPSGRVDTIGVNCIINALLFTAFMIFQNPDFDYEGFWAQFTGDDNCVAVDPKLNYDISKLKEFMAMCGYEITAADKDSELRLKYAVELNYLKRDTVIHPISRKYVGALQKQSIYKSLAYMVGNPTGVELHVRMAGTFEAAQREMFLHSAEELLELQKQVREAGFAYRELSVDFLTEQLLDGNLKTWETVTESH
jgi:hypothetical protein